MWKWTGCLAVAGFMAAGTAEAEARTCGPREHVIERLEGRYGETRQSAGLAANRQMVEVYASRDTGTWTILMTSAAGLTCLVATGQAFEDWPGERTTKGDPA